MEKPERRGRIVIEEFLNVWEEVGIGVVIFYSFCLCVRTRMVGSGYFEKFVEKATA